MRRLETSELRNVTHEILTKHLESLHKVTYGATYEARLRTIEEGFAALPEAVLRMPLADVLAAFDEEHDAWARAVDHIVRAVEEGPKVLQALASVVALVRDRYMTKLAEVQSAYAVADQRGQDRLARLPGDAATLSAVPTPDGKTLRDWIEAYATSGTKLGTTLGERADHLAGKTLTPGLQTFTELRADLVGTIGRLRTQIELDLQGNPALPRTLEKDVLGHLDEVVRLSEARAKTAKPATTEAAQPTPTGTPA